MAKDAFTDPPAHRSKMTILREHVDFPVDETLEPARPIWVLLAWVLIIGGLWDGGGLVFGPPSFFSSPSYAAIRAIGLQKVGVILLAITVAFIWNLATNNTRNLRIVCSAGFIYNLFWLICLLFSWFSVGISAWPGPTKAASLGVIYLILAVKVDERRG